MILWLELENFLFLESIRLPFVPGFNAIVGDSGSGKSLLLDSIEQIFSKKNNYSLVQEGKDFCRLAICISTKNSGESVENAWLSLTPQTKPAGKQNNLQNTNSCEWVVEKTLYASGKYKLTVNGESVSNKQLQTVAGLFDLNMQHSQWELLHDPTIQQTVFDKQDHIQTALASFKTELQQLEQVVYQWQEYTQEYNRVMEFLTIHAENAKLLEYMAIEAPDGIAVDFMSIEQSLQQKKNKHTLLEGLGVAEQVVATDPVNVQLLLETLKKQIDKLADKSKNIPSMSILQQIAIEIQDTLALVHSWEGVLLDLTHSLELETHTIHAQTDIHALETRLDQYNTLLYHFGPSIENVCQFYESWKEHQHKKIVLETHIHDCQLAIQSHVQIVETAAKKLQKTREKYKPVFELAMNTSIQELGMGNRIHMRLEKPKQGLALWVQIQGFVQVPDTLWFCQNYGLERVVLWMSSSQDSAPKPLDSVASGGEISRVLFALKAQDKTRRPLCTIFDEVDAGLSGNTAGLLGHQLWKLGQMGQVIAISHTPHTFVFADGFFMVQKKWQAQGIRVLVENANSWSVLQPLLLKYWATEENAEQTSHWFSQLFEEATKNKTAL
jgi:DNA repair protein RecN (Recombination protein N)